MKTKLIPKIYIAVGSAALLILSQSAVLASTPTQLQVTSTDFSAITHQAKVTVFNPSPKIVVAYSLRVASIDSTGKVMGELTVGFDLLCLSGSPCQNDQDQVKPQKSIVREVSAMEGAVGVDVTAAGAIYEDRTFDGDPLNTVNIFTLRANLSKDLTLAHHWLSSSPPRSAADWQTILDKARVMGSAATVTSELANHTSNPLQTICLVPNDRTQSVGTPAAAPTPGQIEEMKNALASAAAFQQQQSQAVNQ